MAKRKKVQKDKQRSTKHTYKTKDRVTRTPLKTGGELRCSGRVSSSCSTSDTRRVSLVTNLVISHERGKDREVFLVGYFLPDGHFWLTLTTSNVQRATHGCQNTLSNVQMAINGCHLLRQMYRVQLMTVNKNVDIKLSADEAFL